MQKLLLLFVATYLFALEVPKLTSQVVDNAGFFTTKERESLLQELKSIEKSTTNQIAILTIKSLEGESLEDYSIKVVDKWKLGQKDKDNGILMLYVKDSRDIRIEVGYGLEGALNDGIVGSIIREDLIPNFKSGDFYKGTKKALADLNSATKGEYVEQDTNKAEKGLDIPDNVQSAIAFYVIFFAFLGSISKFSKIVGAVLGAIGSVIIAYITLTHSILLLIVIAIIGAIIGAYVGELEGYSPRRGSSSSSRRGGGGGFSGGGGSFGGGGASGKW
jgi:uncharacterized protein